MTMKIIVFWDAMQPGRNLWVFWRNLLHPSSRQSNTHTTLNKEAAGSTAVFINFYQINHCIPKEKINANKGKQSWMQADSRLLLITMSMQPISLICSIYLKNKALPKQECTNIYTDLHANSKSHQNICKNSTHATNKTAKSAKLIYELPIITWNDQPTANYVSHWKLLRKLPGH